MDGGWWHPKHEWLTLRLAGTRRSFLRAVARRRSPRRPRMKRRACTCGGARGARRGEGTSANRLDLQALSLSLCLFLFFPISSFLSFSLSLSSSVFFALSHLSLFVSPCRSPPWRRRACAGGRIQALNRECAGDRVRMHPNTCRRRHHICHSTPPPQTAMTAIAAAHALRRRLQSTPHTRSVHDGGAVHSSHTLGA